MFDSEALATQFIEEEAGRCVKEMQTELAGISDPALREAYLMRQIANAQAAVLLLSEIVSGSDLPSLLNAPYRELGSA